MPPGRLAVPWPVAAARLGRWSSLTASHGGRLAASEAASAGLPVAAASAVHASGQSPGWQGLGAAAAATRASSSSTTLAAGPDGNHTVTATATGTSSSLASYIAALIGFAIDAHPESRRPRGRRVPVPVPASLSLASSLFPSRPSASSSVIRRVILNGLGAAVLLSKFWHSSSPCIVRFQVPCQCTGASSHGCCTVTRTRGSGTSQVPRLLSMMTRRLPSRSNLNLPNCQ
jgi:hypothetical protein